MIPSTFEFESWNDLAASADGKYLYATVELNNNQINEHEGYLYRSSDFGATWINSTVATQFLNYIASSASGKYVVGVTSAYAYISSNFGESWQMCQLPIVPTSTLALRFSAVASSSDGSKLFATLVTITITDTVYTNYVLASFDFGMSWGILNVAAGPSPGVQGPQIHNWLWNSIAASSDGLTLTVVPTYGYITTAEFQQDSSDEDEEEVVLSTGAIVGITVGSAAAVGVGAAAGWFFFMSKASTLPLSSLA